MTRLSNGLFLEVLTARPQAGVPLEVTVWDGANPANMLAELQGASQVTFQHILSDVGSGKFRIARDDPKATTANIREGNLVKVRLNDVDVFPYFIEAPKLIVAEGGKSYWELAGPGALSALAQAVVYPPGWPTSTGTDRVWTAATAGSVLKTLIDEAQARGALAHVTYDFDATVDSHNNPWPADLELTTHAGTRVLDVAKQLAALGIDMQMTPGLVFQAFVAGSFGRNLETTVIWRYGRHIAGEVQKVGIRSALQNAELVEGASGTFIEVNDPTSQADPYTGRREGGLSFTSSSDPTTLQSAGDAQMSITQADANAISVPLIHGTDAGNFTPYADYQPGDWVTLDVPGQYDLEAFQIRGLTLTQTPGSDYATTADLNAVALDYLVRLRNMITGATGSGSAAAGSVSANLSGGRPSPSASSGTPALTLSTTNAPGTSTAFVATDATIAAFDGTLPTASAPGDAGATGSAGVTAHRDHKHAREAWGAAGDIGTETFGASAGAGASGKVADAGHVHPMPASPAVPSPATTVTGPDAYGASAVVGTATDYARSDHDHGLPASTEGLPLGLTGAIATTRYVGATTSGAPVSGTFAVGDFIVDQSGSLWICTVAGAPGTWVQVSGGGGSSDHKVDVSSGDTTADYLLAKLAAGTNITLTKLNAGANEQVQIAASGGGGGGVLGAISYSSGANGVWHSTTSSTVSDIDATNAALAITVPASGNVIVMIQGEFWETVAGGQFLIGIRTGTTTLATMTTPMTATSVAPPSVGPNYGNLSPYWFYLTGLTPGSLTIKAAWASAGGSARVNVAAYDGASGHDNPFVMVAWAA